jgi:hypothetical protein
MRILCLLGAHRWEPDPDSKESYPVLRCRRCAKRREMAADLVNPRDVRAPGRWRGTRPDDV